MKRVLGALICGAVIAACMQQQARVRKASDASAEALRELDGGTPPNPLPVPQASTPNPPPPGALSPPSKNEKPVEPPPPVALSPSPTIPPNTPPANIRVAQGNAAPAFQPAETVLAPPPPSQLSKQPDFIPEPARPKPQLSSQQGLSLLTLPATQSPIVDVQLQFRSGAVDDPPGKSGITSLAARVMVEGGTQALDAKALLTALFPMAAELDVRVDKEVTTFIARVHRDHLAAFVPILTDVLLHPRWDANEFKRLREDQVNYVSKHLRQGDDEQLGKEALQEALYNGHPYGRLTEGHVADLKSLTLEDLKAQAARVFTRDRLVVGLAGGAPGELAAQLVQSLSALPEKGAQPVAIPQQRPHGPRFVLVEKESDSTAVSIGLPYSLSRKDPDWAALSVARSAFGEHRQFNGRLMQRLREQRGLNYGDYAYIENFRQEGGSASQAQTGRGRHQQEFSIWLRPIQNQNRLFAVRAALYELSRSLHEEPFSPEEVQQTKSFLDGYLLLFDQTDARRLGYALDDAFYGMPGFLGAWHTALHEVTADQVNAAWRKWIDASKVTVVMAGKEMAPVKAALLSGAPTEMHYAPSVKPPQAQLDTDARINAFPFGASSDADVVIIPVSQEFE